jgi:hypothetical protein
MRISRRSALAISVFVLLGIVVALGTWYEQRRLLPEQSTDSTVVNVTNGGDRGPGTLREALFIAAAATSKATIVIKVANIAVESALPPVPRSTRTD